MKTFAPSSHDYLKMTKKINIYYQNSLTVAKHVIYLYIHPTIRAKNIYKRKRQNNESTIQPTIFVKQSSREHTYTWKKEHKRTSPVDTHTHLALNSSKTAVE